MTSESLWPDNLGVDLEDVESPHSMLSSQTRILGEKTNGILTCAVETIEIKSREERDFFGKRTTVAAKTIYRFSIVGDDGFKFRLFEYSHAPELPYPGLLKYDDAVTEIPGPFELRRSLRVVFASNATKSVIYGITARRKDRHSRQTESSPHEGSPTTDPATIPDTDPATQD